MTNETKEQVLKIFRGLPASGKSTAAINWVAEDPENRARVNRDDLRVELFNQVFPINDKAGSVKEKENKVTEVEQQLLRTYLAQGKDVVSDNTNLNPRVFKTYSTIASEAGVKLTHQDFPISIEEAIRRNNARDRVVPEDVIRRMAKDYLGPNGEFHLFPGDYPVTPFVKPAERRQAVIFDADGTLVDIRGIRDFVRGKYRNFDMFHRSSLWSPPNDQVVQMAFDAHDAGFAIIVVTARSEPYRAVTQKWMDDNNIPYENIYMRAEDDMRKDYLVKHDILKDIRVDYDVVHAVDDNIHVKRTWLENGIQTTVVPGFVDGEVPDDEEIKIVNMFRSGGCLRCGKPLKSGANLGPRCATLI